MNLTQALSATFLASCLTLPTPFGTTQSQDNYLPSAGKDISILSGGEESTSLFRALSMVAESSGVQVHAESKVFDELRNSSCGFERDFTIPAGEAWAVVEHALMQNSYVLCMLHSGETKIVAVRSAYDQRNPMGVSYQSVSVDELDYVESHPGIMFEVSLNLEHTDTRMISHQLRDLRLNDGLFECTVTSRDVLLRGVGNKVGPMARRLFEMDERAGARPEPETEPQSQGATAG